MREALRVVSLDAAGRVRRVALLRPKGVFVDRGARWILELPPARTAPAVGAVLHVRRLSAVRPAHCAAFDLLP